MNLGEEQMTLYKLTRPDGTDFYSGTIDYAANVGKIVMDPNPDRGSTGVCVRGLHACANPNDCFVGAEIPCRAFEVEGVGLLGQDDQKQRFAGLKVVREITDLDQLFGWKYSEAINPVNPFEIEPPEITADHLELLKTWSSVWSSVRVSVRDSVWDSAGDSAGVSVWKSVWSSVWSSVRDSVWDSVWKSVWAYVGSLFPNIERWAHIDHRPGEYPFQPAVDLWRQGLVPSFDGAKWRLHGGPDGKVIWEGTV